MQDSEGTQRRSGQWYRRGLPPWRTPSLVRSPSLPLACFPRDTISRLRRIALAALCTIRSALSWGSCFLLSFSSFVSVLFLRTAPSSAGKGRRISASARTGEPPTTRGHGSARSASASKIQQTSDGVGFLRNGRRMIVHRATQENAFLLKCCRAGYGSSASTRKYTLAI